MPDISKPLSTYKLQLMRIKLKEEQANKESGVTQIFTLAQSYQTSIILLAFQLAE